MFALYGPVIILHHSERRHRMFFCTLSTPAFATECVSASSPRVFGITVFSIISGLPGRANIKYREVS